MKNPPCNSASETFILRKAARIMNHNLYKQQKKENWQ